MCTHCPVHVLLLPHPQQELGYQGPTPPSVTEASAIIAQLIRIARFRLNAAAKGYTPVQIAEMEADMLMKGKFD